MKLGVCSNSLRDLPLDAMLDWCVEHGVQAVELACGGGDWSPNCHIDPDALLDSRDKRDELMGKITSRGLSISALNCSGNPLDPVHGAMYDAVIDKAVLLGEALGVTRIVTMSGLPPAVPGDRAPNWITLHFPPELGEMLEYQWSQAVPYWTGKAAFAREHGIGKIAFENHGQQLVYSMETLERLRAGVGAENAAVMGLNLDTSHSFYMGSDPVRITEVYGHLIFYVHVKDVRFNEDKCALNTLHDPKPADRLAERSWNATVAGDGHGAAWWRRFARALQTAGYDDVMVLEVGDKLLAGPDGVARAARFMHNHVL